MLLEGCSRCRVWQLRSLLLGKSPLPVYALTLTLSALGATKRASILAAFLYDPFHITLGGRKKGLCLRGVVRATLVYYA